MYSAAIQPSFIKAVRGHLPKGTIQIKKRVLQGISAGTPAGVRGATVTAERMEMIQVCV